jgi:hypothetical protein
MEVYVSDSITKAVTIDHRGHQVEVRSKTAYFHLEEQNNMLKLYVPKDKRQREVCLLGELPVTLLKHLGAKDVRSAAELAPVIAASSLFAVDSLLELAGIIELEGIPRPPDDDDEDGQVSSDARSDAPSSVWTPESQSAPSYFTPRTSRRAAAGGPSFTPIPTALSPPPERPDLYKQLLNAVIQQAKSVDSLPGIGESIFARVAGTDAVSTSAAVNSRSQEQKNINIGAAGELFVNTLHKLEECHDYTDLFRFTKS